MRASHLLALAAAAFIGAGQSLYTLPATPRNYSPAKGKTGALKIRRAAAKARNVVRHKRNCRG